mgnify:CR=1 FL=1
MMHYVLGVYEYESILSIDCVFSVFKTVNKTVELELSVQYGYVVFNICLRIILLLKEESIEMEMSQLRDFIMMK